MEIRTPLLAVDMVIRLWEEEKFRGIVLIERKNEPKGFALPGGFVGVGESVEQAVIREMKEETGLDVEISHLLGVYSDPSRDPRGHVASVVFVGDARGEPKAGSDAKRVHVFKLEEIPFESLVFDHGRILKDFIRSL